jgi:predicted amidohydrolase
VYKSSAKFQSYDMAKNLNVALLPLEIIWGDKQQNLQNLEAYMQQLHPATDLLILPETFSTGFITSTDKEEVRNYAERNTGATIDFIKMLAHKHGVAIAGSYIADSGGSLYNRAFFIEPSGEETFEDKKHLFTMANEDKVFSHGHKRLAVRYRGWNLAMVICYDVRFPVWCRNANNEYDTLIAVANWPKVRVDAWEQLLKARAIENEAYVCAVNCKGTDLNGFEYDGLSAIYDFKGKSINVVNEGSPFIYASLDMDKLSRFREKFPAWKDADSFSIL